MPDDGGQKNQAHGHGPGRDEPWTQNDPVGEILKPAAHDNMEDWRL